MKRSPVITGRCCSICEHAVVPRFTARPFVWNVCDVCKSKRVAS